DYYCQSYDSQSYDTSLSVRVF
nr:immunoglobulin light chain junction region [Macaca mulatta]MOV67227.1 immunoglobulin light chain junction region [Macaca mulatta]MOV69813.1 immunoglobulin light chain junction region [Macaca mulatta]